MAFKNNGLPNSRWAPANFQQAPRYPPTTPAHHVNTFHHQAPNADMNMTHLHHDLDPSVPNFQPSGTELQRYQGPSAFAHAGQASPSTPTDISQIQHYVLNTHFAHTKAVAGLERQNQNTRSEIENVKEIVGRDVRALEDQIASLRKEVAEQREESGSELRNASRGDSPRSFSNEKIADRYLDEAEDLEKTAEKLREQAKEMSTTVATQRLVKMKLLDAPDHGGETVNGVVKMDHVCCGEIFGSVDEMLGHVAQTHAHASQIGTSLQAANGFEKENDTPTHVPPRRVKVNKDETIVEAINSDDNMFDAEVANGAGSAHQDKPASYADAVNGKNSDAAVARENIKPEAEHAKPSSDRTDAPTTWFPLAVRNMAPPPPQIFTAVNTETFSWEFLVRTFGGKQWSPSYYFITDDSDLPSKSYWVLDAEYEPFLPSLPGQHGAKLTAFFNDASSGSGDAPLEENFHSVPVFVRGKGEDTYVYFGQYSQMRFSDKLSHGEVMEKVPEHVRKYWAGQLADKGRPGWVTEALMQQFWPKPTYYGPMPTDSSFNSPASTIVGDDEGEGKATQSKKIDRVILPLEKKLARALVQHAEDLSEWRKEAEMKVNLLTADALIKSFEAADADEEPGLRLWWEYLECVGYDHGFYDYLVAIKRDPGLKREAVAVTASKGGKKAKEATTEKKGGKSKNEATQAKRCGGSVETSAPAANGVVANPPKDTKAPPPSLTVKSKTHLKSTKPYQQDTGSSSSTTTKAKADAAMKQSSNADLAKVYANFTIPSPGHGGMNGARSLPPHLRRGK